MLNVEVGDLVIDVVDDAYRVRRNDEVLGYRPVFSEALTFACDQGIKMSDVQSIGELKELLRQQLTQICIMEIVEQAPVAKPVLSSDPPPTPFAPPLQAFIDLHGREPENNSVDRKEVKRIAAFQVKAEKHEGKDWSDVVRNVCLEMNVASFRKLPGAKEKSAEVKIILKSLKEK